MINGIYASGFSPRLREIALVRIGAVTKAEYELHQHHFIALKNGVTEEEIQAIIHEKSVNSLEKEANLICRAVDELQRGFAISDETFDELAQHFNTKDIVSLGVAVAMYFAVAILANFCRLEIESSNPLKEFKGFKEN
ncbi:carboxymuconolactone decarboxylase family protein [Legionella sp. km772]|uniref:carboxymuconolactone decarboxylase family protein n=1 Tax=Legionella sp. km772 TaxID=2498111 RepID=UPI000F8DD139|nr:carboxymuconolactone decarboxylase family protein [Legionella sp. km772]RUR04770.1 carboxymuconolactone decarboxylase family protein [Legionella sp. km772]